MTATFVAGRPITQGSMRSLGHGRMTHDNVHLKAWRTAVGWSMRTLLRDEPPTEKDITVRCHFFVRQRRVNDRPDLDKLVRAVLDALTGVSYVDDAQVVHIDARRTLLAHEGEEGVALEVVPT